MTSNEELECQDCGTEITEAESKEYNGLCWHCMWAIANE